MDWIDVKQKLPEDQGWGESIYIAVWVVTEIESPFWMQARYDHIKQIFKTLEDEGLIWHTIKGVTHWTYLSEPTVLNVETTWTNTNTNGK